MEEKSIDKTSEYYRQCPNCKSEFMALHMNTKFCSDKCGDDFNNAKKRLAKKKDEVINESPNKEKTIEAVDETRLLENNYSILKNLHVEPTYGTPYKVEYLHSLGYNFGVFNGKRELCNIDKKHNCHFLQVKEFRLFLIEYSTILIANTNTI